MAIVDSPQRVSDVERTPSLSDEKFDEKDEKGSVQIVETAEVYDDVRAIDLDEEGKERPIVTDVDVATRLISLEDDPTLPAFTFRMWFLGFGLSCFGAVLGQIFYFRPQTIFVSQLFLQILAYLLGVVMQELIPGPGNTRYTFKTPDSAFWRFMNPGPFNMKEHVAITIFASTASSSALAISVFAADDLYYGLQPNAGVGIFTLIGSQLMGYGLGGIMRSFLVYPTYMVYPSLLPTVQLFDALHRGKKDFPAEKARSVLLGLFYCHIHQYIAPTLTGISIVCLASRKSAWVSRIFGGAAGNEGLGLFALCLDWNYVGSGGALCRLVQPKGAHPVMAGGSLGALFTPLSTQLSLYSGTLICMHVTPYSFPIFRVHSHLTCDSIAFCALYANNVWHGQNFPWLSQELFYENGTQYDQLAILDANFRLDRAALEVQVLTKIGTNLSIGATITHVVLWYGKDIIEVIKRYRAGDNYDPHLAKMKGSFVYPEVPMWWYIVIFVGSFAMAMATIYTGHSGLPWWGLIVGILISAIFLPFVVTVYAITGFNTSMQNLVQILGASMMPGFHLVSPRQTIQHLPTRTSLCQVHRRQTCKYFTLYGFNTLQQALALVQDLKMQYTKLPPRATFAVQSLGSVVGGLLNYVIMKVIISSHREVLLDVQGSNIWSGQQVQTFNADAVSWGALGNILYAPSGRYGIIPFSILIGLAVPVPFWIVHRYFPKLGANRVVTPILCWTLGYLSVGINTSVFTTFLLAVFSQFYLRRYRPRWFRKYNFLLSAALDGGTQVMVFVFTFAVGGGSGKVTSMPNWALNPTGNPDYCARLT
ncbi:Oligopeptide transporter 3 [Mycena sanguinolenta]|uniref:Oligopeptide transporter 3 n=1 Tax=Mycena sanguinolenta TaxID=230812 RepID=A0A8H7CL77_9AGAR|nr:Oligopeptide transporter 3 [Mycena sanguinolenta]